MSEFGFLVVARHTDGRIVRGTTSDFRAGRSYFHILPEDGDRATRIAVSELKAIFYVRSLFGDHSHEDTKSFQHRHGVGRKVWVRFCDGEELAGWTVSYSPDRGGFFVFPTDANANAEKAFVVNGAIESVFLDTEAEREAEAYAERGARGDSKRQTVRRIQSDQWNRMLGFEPSGPNRHPRETPRRPRDSGMFLGDW